MWRRIQKERNRTRDILVTPPMRAATLVTVLFLAACAAKARAQRAAVPPTADTNRSKTLRDTTLATSPLPAHLWRAPQAERNGGDLYVTGEALRYYESPTTVPMLFEAMGGAYPLVLGEEAYDRES